VKGAPWFKFFPADFLNDSKVDALPLEAQAILVRMWCVLWAEESLPSDVEEIARKCKVRLAIMQLHMHKLMQFFVHKPDQTYVSVRMEKEKQRSRLVSKARSKAAHAKHKKEVAAHAPADAQTDAHADAHADAHQRFRGSEEDLNPYPQTAFADDRAGIAETKTSTPTAYVNVDQVQKLYDLYPRKREPIDAKKAIRKAISVVMAGDPDHPAMSLIEALDYLAQRLTLYARSVQGSDKKFIPYPASWFSAGSFWDGDSEWSMRQHPAITGNVMDRFREGA